MRNLQLPGRSPVHAMNGLVATTQPLATAAALRVLEEGGNAVDAALTAAALLAVIQPSSAGIGGDCFILYAPASSGRIIAFNGSGRAPAAADSSWYLERGINHVDPRSAHAVTIPGTVDAWSRVLTDYGTKSLDEILRPAIWHARSGYPVTSRLAKDWIRYAENWRLDPGSAATFLPDGRSPVTGEIHRQPRLADTLEAIASNGPEAFYRGEIADRIVEYLRDCDGLHTLDDFASARGEYVDPISFRYRGYDIYECPPNSPGIVALEMLNILSAGTGHHGDPLSPDRLHELIEIAWIAFRDRDNLVGDPDQTAVPVDQILSPDYGSAQRLTVEPDRASRATAGMVPSATDTVYLCVVDRDGSTVSYINSLFTPSLTCPQTGVLLQNRGCGFVVDPGHANCIAGGKRPLHTIIPAMVCKDGRAVMPFGVLGGHYQPVGHVYFLSNLFEYDLDLQEAIDLARITPAPSNENHVEAEIGIPEAAVADLLSRGHNIAPAAYPIGGAQAIWIDHSSGVMTGASDGRWDGCALGY